jgi:hypothetical protein
MTETERIVVKAWAPIESCPHDANLKGPCTCCIQRSQPPTMQMCGMQ